MDIPKYFLLRVRNAYRNARRQHYNAHTPSVSAVGQSGYSLLWSFRLFLIIAASVNQRFIAIKQKGCCAVIAESLFVKLTFPWQSFLSHFLFLLILSNLA